MLGYEIEDYQQLKAVKKKLSEDLSKKLFFKSLFHCGSKVAMVANLSAVAVVANNKTARFYGVTHCKSPWCCPVCTSRQMARYAADIAVAIDALKERDELAAMITLTIPHTRDFTCQESTEILYNSWKDFVVHGNTVLANSKNDIFSNFAAATNHKHRVRVTEYTWGEKGWHPHFHTLFWFPRDKFQSIIDWQERLETRWLEIVKRNTLKQLLLRYPETQNVRINSLGLRKLNCCKELPDAPTIRELLFNVKHVVKVDEMLNKRLENLGYRIMKMYENLDPKSHALYISVDESGKVIEQQSSNYICGWGANREITGNVGYKATNPGHYTWQQILEKAIAEDRAKRALKAPSDSVALEKESTLKNNNLLQAKEGYINKLNELKPAEGSRKNEEGGALDAAQVPAEEDNKWWTLYFEYAKATLIRRHARINYSVHSGLKQIIADYKKSNAYKQFSKKNNMKLEEKFGKWRVICWFLPSQWYAICEKDLEVDILKFAVNGGLTEINRLLEAHGLPPAIEKVEGRTEILEEVLNAA